MYIFVLKMHAAVQKYFAFGRVHALEHPTMISGQTDKRFLKLVPLVRSVIRKYRVSYTEDAVSTRIARSCCCRLNTYSLCSALAKIVIAGVKKTLRALEAGQYDTM